MSENQSGARRFGMLDGKSAAELEELIRQIPLDEIDIDYWNSLMGAYTIRNDISEADVAVAQEKLNKRLLGCEPVFCEETDSSSDNNKTSYLTTHKKTGGIFRLSRAAAVAAVFALMLMVGTITAYALGYDVFGAIATWTKETFIFTYVTDFEEESSIPHKNIGECRDLQEALDEYGVTEKLAPTYVPKGYEQIEFKIYDEDDNLNIVNAFIKDDRTIIISITKNVSSSGAKYQKDEGDPEIYEAGGIKHYIMTNMGNYKAVWNSGEFECGISGLVEKDELIKMIDSIYEE